MNQGMKGNEAGSECLSFPNSLHPLSEHLPEGIEKNGNHVNTIAKKDALPPTLSYFISSYTIREMCAMIAAFSSSVSLESVTKTAI